MGQRRSLGSNRDHMLCGVQAGLLQGVHDKGLIGQGLEGGTGLGNQDEDGMGNVRTRQNLGGIIRVYITNEFRVHEEGIVLLRPVLEGQVHGPRTQVGATDADLNGRRELLAFLIRDFPGVNVVGKIRDALLLLDVK